MDTSNQSDRTPHSFFNSRWDQKRRYPKFTSFEHRKNFLRTRLLKSEELLDKLNQLAHEELDPKQKEVHRHNSDFCSIVWTPALAELYHPEVAASKRNETLGYRFQDVDDGDHVKSEEDSESAHAARLLDHIRRLEVVFVGDVTRNFSPRTGDLVIRSSSGADPCRPTGTASSLITYRGPNSHKFQAGDLVLRIGHYEQGGHGAYIYKPYRNLELHRSTLDGSWTYLGSQEEMIIRPDYNSTVSLAGDSRSPGKYMQVGGRIISVSKRNLLVPRRGDVVIRGAVRDKCFPHTESFWRSMISWHTDKHHQTTTWNRGDFLLRPFVDGHKDIPGDQTENTPEPEPGDHSQCQSHGPCRESHDPPFLGFAELYEWETDPNGWVYHGRTAQTHLNNIQCADYRDPHFIRYVYENEDSDSED